MFIKNRTQIGNIYAGGVFTKAGGNTAKLMAVWNGTSWSELASSISSNNVNSIVSSNNVICVGRNFLSVGDILGTSGVVAFNVVEWIVNNWIQMGKGPTNKGGLTGEIFSIAVDRSDVYFGGNFTQAGGVDANGIALWDGTNWIALGSGVYRYVYSIVVTGPYIYAGGTVHANVIGNYMVAGPDIVRSRYEIGVGENGSPLYSNQIYVEDNIGPHRPNSTLSEWNIVESGVKYKNPAPTGYPGYD